MLSDCPDPFWNVLEAGKLWCEHERQLPLFLMLKSMYFVPFFFLFVQYKHTRLATALQLLDGPQPRDGNTLARPCDSLSLEVRMHDVSP